MVVTLADLEAAKSAAGELLLACYSLLESAHGADGALFVGAEGFEVCFVEVFVPKWRDRRDAVNVVKEAIGAVADPVVVAGVAGRSYHDAAGNLAAKVNETTRGAVISAALRRYPECLPDVRHAGGAGWVEVIGEYWPEVQAALRRILRFDWELAEAGLLNESARAVERAAHRVGPSDDAFVEAGKLAPAWREKFPTYPACKAWLDENSGEIPSYQRGQRRMVHAAKWVKHWAAADAAAFESLGDEPAALTGLDIEAFTEGAAQRLKQVRQKKRAEK